MAVRLAVNNDSTVAAAVPLLRTVLVCDIVDSASVVERLGDLRAAELMRRHDRNARDAMIRFHGREIDKTDGFLILFDRPADAVGFALDYQRSLRTLGDEFKQKLGARVGIHFGEVVLWDNSAADIAEGAKRVEVEGLAKIVASRLSNLALGGQILLTETCHALVQRALAELAAPHQEIRWIGHGAYRLKGISDPISVFEVGEPRIAPLAAPPSVNKARRLQAWWQRRNLWLVTALLLAMPLIYTLRPQPSIPFAERDWVVVGDFSNRTDETRFNDSLATALRIGLEQSRYINVVSDLRSRDTLKLMTLDEDTPIDRKLGSELAQRVGARALILPSISEVAGKVRVTLEVVDPRSTTTVYSDSAEGEGAAAALPALDQVLRGMRGRLGESLSSIEKSSAPVMAVTTDDLDALRAYELARRAQIESRLGDANNLVGHALQLDPEFAIAWALRASLAFDSGRYDDARSFLEQALRRDRLSNRERIRLEAVSALHRGADDADTRWRMVTDLYPDEYMAHLGRAFVVMAQRNDAARALQILQPALVQQNAYLRNAEYLAGVLALGSNDLERARRHFETARAAGVGGDLQAIAFTELLSGDADAARITFNRQQPTGDGNVDLEFLIGALALPIESGRLSEAIAALAAIRQKANPAIISPLLLADLDTIALLLSCETDSHPATREQRAAIESILDSITSPALLTETSLRRSLLAGIAARCRSTDVGSTMASKQPAAKSVELSDQLQTAALAETALAHGDSAAALEAVDARMLGQELYWLHTIALRASTAAGDAVRTERERRWLETHCGRSFVEFNGNSIVRVLVLLNALERGVTASTSEPLQCATSTSDSQPAA